VPPVNFGSDVKAAPSEMIRVRTLACVAAIRSVGVKGAGKAGAGLRAGGARAPVLARSQANHADSSLLAGGKQGQYRPDLWVRAPKRLVLGGNCRHPVTAETR